MGENEKNIYLASDNFYRAVNRLLQGDIKPMEDAWSHADDVTNAGPFGKIYIGWDDVRSQLEREARMKLGGTVRPRGLQVHAGSDRGYTVCIEEGENLMAGGQPVRVSHRATTVYRLEYGLWKVVHHHTDVSMALEAAAQEEEAMAVGRR